MSKEIEQQQLQQIKDWLAENWKVLVLGLVLGGGISGGWSGWNYYSESSSQRVAENFAQLQQQSFALYQSSSSAESSELEQSYRQLQTQSQELISANADSIYAELSALLLARAAVELSDYSTAEAQLSYVYNSSAETAIRETARLRLANVYWQQDQTDQALELLQRQPIASEYASLLAELSGDISHSLGRLDAAYGFYQEARRLAGANQTSPLLAIKLSSTAPAGAPADTLSNQ